MTVSTLIPTMFAIHDRVDHVCDAVDDLKFRVRIEGIRVALDSTITLLDEPTPDRVKAARDMLRNFRAELPGPPDTQPDLAE